MTHIAETFRALHKKGDPFILVNVWDRGSARMMAAMGAKALATSSAAHAFTLGRPDGGTLTRDEALAHAADIVAATQLPVQGDFENGFGDDPDTCAETVRLAAEVGLAGICIEDIALPSSSAYDFDLAVERIRAASSAARALPHDFMLTARADGIMCEQYDVTETIKRLQAFEVAGADCLYAPLPASMVDQARICAAITAPVNALAAGKFTQNNLSDFAKTGVARVSLGASLARVIHKAIYDTARTIFHTDNLHPLSAGISGNTIDKLLM